MSWIADRTQYCDSSGIRKVFDLAATMNNPINLSIGQPDFDVPADGASRRPSTAIQGRKNGYALTQGMPVLREKLAGADRPAVSATPTATCSSPAAPAAGWCWRCWPR